MSTKLKAANLYDQIALKFWPLLHAENSRSIALTPVFHVEQLYVDRYFTALYRFLFEYLQLTGLRAVITCMTPSSPILMGQIGRSGFTAEKYWERIATLGEYGIVGLHGHFVRSIDFGRIVPMHCSFYDLEKIEAQIARELGDLIERRLVNQDLLIYSGGWWFTSPGLRKLLAEFDFKWDFTISSSPFNISPGAHSLATDVSEGVRQEIVSGRTIKSAVAVCSIAKSERPFQSFSKIASECRQYPTGPVMLSLYCHDYDLDCDAALTMVRRYLDSCFSFKEPN